MNIFNAFRHHRSIVRITSKAGIGTGFWIKGRDGQWYILTCAHVVHGDEAPTLAFCQSDDSYAGAHIATVIRREEAADLAVLTCPTPPADAQALELLDIDFQEPPPFFAWGFPKVHSVNGRQGQGQVTSILQSGKRLQLKCEESLVPGFSGGPIIDVQNKSVLGISVCLEPTAIGVNQDNQEVPTGSEPLYYAISAKLIGEKLGDLFQVSHMNRYQAWLAGLYRDVVLHDDQGMRLSDVYVEPYFGVHESCVEKEHEGKKDNNRFYPLKRSIHQEVMAWIQGQRLNIPQKNSQVLLLLGYPGQGKTSFTKRLLHEVTQAIPDKNCYWVQLKSIQGPSVLKNRPLDCIEEAIIALAERELDIIPDIQFKNALLVLDGLDELSIQRDISGQDIDDICQRIEEHAKQFKGLQIVLTSRYGYVQLEKIKTCDILVWQLAELSLEQQLNWLNKYKTFHLDVHLTPELLEKYNEDEAYEAIKELITQPILLQMIARLPEDLSQNTNRADIYDRMFSQLVRRAWSEDKKQITLLKKDEGGKLLREALGEMAFEIFHSDKGYLYKSQIDQLSSIKQLQKEIGTGMDMWRAVMVAFYMEEVKKGSRNEAENDRDHDYAVEFLHKSLPEYLCAEYLWRQVKKCFWEQFQEEPDRALDDLYKIFRNKLISQEIVQYLIQLAEKDKEADKEILLERLTWHLDYFLKRDFYPVTAKDKPYDTIRTLVYGFLTVSGALGSGMGEVITEKNKVQWIRLLKMLVYDWNTYYLNLAEANLEGANLEGANLKLMNFTKINLKHSSLKVTSLWGTTLHGGNLFGVKLTMSDMPGANLSYVDLTEANLTKVNLAMANLEHAQLKYVDMRDVSLIGANLKYANLNNSILRDADLRDADFTKSSLMNTDMKNTILYGIVLFGANLRDARYLTIDQLRTARTLYNCTGLPPEMEAELRKTHPYLFEKPKSASSDGFSPSDE